MMADHRLELAYVAYAQLQRAVLGWRKRGPPHDGGHAVADGQAHVLAVVPLHGIWQADGYVVELAGDAVEIQPRHRAVRAARRVASAGGHTSLFGCARLAHMSSSSPSYPSPSRETVDVPTALMLFSRWSRSSSWAANSASVISPSSWRRLRASSSSSMASWSNSSASACSRICSRMKISPRVGPVTGNSKRSVRSPIPVTPPQTA